ncbi:FCD domain-containing protein [Zhihengliuella sp.]|uniref:FadR/GntR family transcriptional regulator n=1 Tax=Zhihengliuella sp. TaxID=1954483 RepID=UPI0028124FB5|nr:FCD domain-containing protein [Zhihengliuella sp.]
MATRTDALTAHLRAQIVDGTLPPGTRLPSESGLMAEHGVGRSAVRESLTRLQAEGLVHTRRGAGSFVLAPPPDPADTPGIRPVRTLEDRAHLLGFRLALEPEAAALAAGHRTDADLADLAHHLDRLDAAADRPAEALGSDFAFHLGIARASGNPYLADAIAALGPLMIAMPRARLAGAGTSTPAQVHAEHLEILECLTGGDAAGAAAAMRVHLTASRRRLSAAGRHP